MYDLKADPLERTNLAYKHHKRTPTQEREYKRLRHRLAEGRADALAAAQLSNARAVRPRDGARRCESLRRHGAPPGHPLVPAGLGCRWSGHRAGRAVLRGVGQPRPGLFGRFARWLWSLAQGEVVKRVGGPARARVITLFALVLALNGADASTVGAIAPQLESGLHINNTDLGLLSSVSLLVGAVFTIPVGLFVDRTKRMPLLAICDRPLEPGHALQRLRGQLLEPAADEARAGSGGSDRRAGDLVADGRLLPGQRTWGDLVLHPRGRGRGDGLRLHHQRLRGQRVPLAGRVRGAVDSRASSWPASCGGPCPSRCGAARATSRWGPRISVRPSRWPRNGPSVESPRRGARGPGGRPRPRAAREAAERAGAVPNPALVLHEDPSQMGLWRSVRYLFEIPSNRLMIFGSSLGYFYFAGLSTFALLFVKGHYHASQAEAELVLALLVVGAVIGTVVGGRIGDRMLRHGQPGGARLVSGPLLHRRGRAAGGGPAQIGPHPRAVVRDRRRGADLRRQPPGPGCAAGHRAGGPVGTHLERPHGRAIAGPGAGAAAVRRHVAADRGDRAPAGPDRHPPPRAPARGPPPGCRSAS